MDLLNDIKKILFKHNDKEHHLEISISWDTIKVYLTYDPAHDFSEDVIIPIYYDTLEEFAYIPDNKYREKFNPGDFGIDSSEIKIINEIMQYLESHKKEINDLVDGYCADESREKVGD